MVALAMVWSLRAEVVRLRRDPSAMGEERVVRFSVRSIVIVIGLVIAAWALLTVLSITRHVLTWILVALFLAMALNPAVEWFMRRGVTRRGYAAGLTFLIALAVIAGIAYLFVPTLVNNVND